MDSKIEKKLEIITYETIHQILMSNITLPSQYFYIFNKKLKDNNINIKETNNQEGFINEIIEKDLNKLHLLMKNQKNHIDSFLKETENIANAIEEKKYGEIEEINKKMNLIKNDIEKEENKIFMDLYLNVLNEKYLISKYFLNNKLNLLVDKIVIEGLNNINKKSIPYILKYVINEIKKRVPDIQDKIVILDNKEIIVLRNRNKIRNKTIFLTTEDNCKCNEDKCNGCNNNNNNNKQCDYIEECNYVEEVKKTLSSQKYVVRNEIITININYKHIQINKIEELKQIMR
jgi:hypothetical protein